MLLRATHDLLDLFRRQRDWQHPVLKAVIREDVGKRWRDDGSKTKLTQRPRCVFTRRAAAEVFIGHEYRRTFITRLVQHKRRVRLTVGAVAPVAKQKLTKPCAFDSFEKLL